MKIELVKQIDELLMKVRIANKISTDTEEVDRLIYEVQTFVYSQCDDEVDIKDCNEINYEQTLQTLN